jgi:SAM-dependent methyltransferase
MLLRDVKEHKSGNYHIDRGLRAIANEAVLKVNLLRYLDMLFGELRRPVEVLEAGCGNGVTLSDIKRILPEKVRVTGITLNETQGEAALSRPGSRIDEVIVGAVEIHDFGKEFDFLLDFFGPARYLPPETIIPTYGRILAPGGFAFIGGVVVNVPSELFGENKLEVVDSGSSISHHEFLLRSTK